jgi:hypothetical protein
MTAVTPVAACGNSGDPSRHAVGVGDVPHAVQKMVDAPQPAAGGMRVQRRGGLQVAAGTLFCTINPDVAPSLRQQGVRGTGLVGLSELLQKWRLPINVDGSHRQRLADPKNCSTSGNPIISKGYVSLNRDGKPYRLVMAFWQGDSVWVGSIERGDGGDEPPVFNPYGLNPLPLRVERDTQYISKVFLSELVRK